MGAEFYRYEAGGYCGLSDTGMVLRKGICRCIGGEWEGDLKYERIMRRRDEPATGWLSDMVESDMAAFGASMVVVGVSYAGRVEMWVLDPSPLDVLGLIFFASGPALFSPSSSIALCPLFTLVPLVDGAAEDAGPLVTSIAR